MAALATIKMQLAGRRLMPMGAARPRGAVTLLRPLPPCAAFDLTPEQQEVALQKQVKLSAERAAAEEELKRQAAAKAAMAAEQPQSLIPMRKPSRRAVRLAAAAATKEAEATSRQQSTVAQQYLAARLATLDDQTMASALRMQLKQSGTFDEAEPAEISQALEEIIRSNGHGNGASHEAHAANDGNGALHAPSNSASSSDAGT